MRSSRSRRAILVVALLSMSLIPLGIGSVAAQSNSTASSSGASETIAQVDPDLRVTSVSYDEDSSIMSIELANREGGGGSQITVTEVVSPGGGSSSFGIEQLRIYDGETTTAQLRIEGDTPGAMITSQDSIEEGSGSYVEAESGIQLVSGAATWRDVQIGIVVAAVATGIMWLLRSWQIVARQSADYEEVDLT
jgi:hypothetical protein